MKPLDIGLVCQNVVRRDGQGRVSLELARALVARGHKVTVYAHRLDPELRDDVAFRRIPRPPGPQLVDDLVFLALATLRIRRAGHDVGCVLGPTALPRRPFVYNAQFSHRGWRQTWTRTTRPGLYHRVHARIVGALEAFCARRADRIISSTAALAEELLPGCAAKAVVVPNGIDLAEFTVAGAEQRTTARRRFGLGAEDFVVGFLGNWSTPRKGLDPLLRALARSERGERLLLASDGDRRALSERLERLGLRDRVVVAGFAPPQEVLAASDVACVPSLYEPFSLVALEASAMGVPVVVAASAGAAALVCDAAVVVDDVTDPGLLLEGIQALGDPGERRARGRKGRELAEALTWDRLFVRAAETVEEIGAPTGDRLRAVYVADTMTDVRMLEGLSGHMEVTFLAPAGLGDRLTNSWPPRPPARVDRVLLRGGRVSFAFRAVLWLVRHRKRYDVAFALDNLVAALAANVAHRLGGPPVVLQLGRPTLDYVRCQRGVRGGVAQRAREVVAGVLVGANERLARGIGAVSEYVGRSARARNGNVGVVHWYGVDTERFAPAVSRTDARERLGLPTERPIVMYRSRIAPEKDPLTFLRAIERLREQGRDVTALYMGGEWREFADLAASVGVDVIATKPSSMDEIPLWYIAADVDVQTSHAEGLGVSPLEALACGTPVVVSDCGGLPEVVDGGRCGALVAPADAEATAHAIANLLDDPDRAAEVARLGRAWVQQRCEARDMFEAWAELASSVTRGRRRPRVLFVDHESRLSGGQRDLVDLVRALGARVEVHAALPEEGELARSLRAHGATVHVVEMGTALRKVSRFTLARRPDRAVGQIAAAGAAMLRLARLARRLRPDVVHSNSLKAHLLAAPAAKLARAQYVWHVRDILDGWLREAWRVVGGLVSDRIVCLSEVAAAPFRKGRAAGKVQVVYNGIRPRRADEGWIDSWRTRLGATNGEAIVGIAGQLARWKGQDTFVEAAALLARKRGDVRFAIVGECLFPENERAYVEALHERADELGLDGRLRFVGHADPIEPVMAALDVFVHASREPEPFGRVIVEAMAQGTPVVASALGAGPELVPPRAGHLVEPDDPAALAEAIDELLRDDVARVEAGIAAREVAAGFDIDRTGEGVLEVYRELLSCRMERSDSL